MTRRIIIENKNHSDKKINEKSKNEKEQLPCTETNKIASLYSNFERLSGSRCAHALSIRRPEIGDRAGEEIKLKLHIYDRGVTEDPARRAKVYALLGIMIQGEK